MRILMIDDETPLGELTEAVIQQHIKDASVEQVPDCVTGLDRLYNKKYDLVLLDQGLANMTGLECLKRIRATWPDLPVVIVTGDNSEELRTQSMKLGADGYVYKPVLSDLLVHVIWAAPECRKHTREAEAETARRQKELRAL